MNIRVSLSASICFMFIYSTALAVPTLPESAPLDLKEKVRGASPSVSEKETLSSGQVRAPRKKEVSGKIGPQSKIHNVSIQPMYLKPQPSQQISPIALLGPGSSGGGDVILAVDKEIGDDEVAVADDIAYLSYQKTSDDSHELLNSDDLISLGQGLRAELRRISVILDSFGAEQTGYGNHQFVDKDYRDPRYSKFILEQVLDPRIRYHLVEHLPTFPECKERLSYGEVRNGMIILQAACTIGEDTWLRKGLFEKMSLRNQGLLITHEGLRRGPVGISNALIANIITSLKVGLDILNRQLAGNRDSISEMEMKVLGGFPLALAYAGLTEVDPRMVKRDKQFQERLNSRKIYPHGGAWVDSNAQIDKDVFLGIGTFVSSGAVIHSGTTLIATNACDFRGYKSGFCKIQGNGTKIIYSNVSPGGVRNLRQSGISPIFIPEKVYIRNSILITRYAWTLGVNAEIVNSQIIICDGSIDIGSDTRIIDSAVIAFPAFSPSASQATSYVLLNKGAQLLRSVLGGNIVHNIGSKKYSMPIVIEVGENSIVEDSEASFISVRLGKQAQLKNLKGGLLDFLVGLSNGGLKFNDDAVFDFKGDYLCPDQTNHFSKRPFLRSIAVRDAADLLKYCNSSYDP